MRRRPPRSTLFPYTTRFRSADLLRLDVEVRVELRAHGLHHAHARVERRAARPRLAVDLRRVLEVLRRSEEHTSELQSRQYLVCRLLLEKKIDLDEDRNSPSL